MTSATIKIAPEQVLEEVLARAKSQTEAAEVYYLSSDDTPIEFENNRLKSVQTKSQQGVALRAIVNGKIGFASSTDLSRLDELVAAAVQTASIGEVADFDFAADLQVQEDNVAAVPPSTNRLVEVGDRLIAQVLEYNPDILVSVDFTCDRV